uniref:Protein kinase domain-containing protein n=1 Tax=Meloidogyne enterolobii TaxID=390850 RepID=A0A6V7UHB9_MELEN|nr:unnamed protein product [Meloidogyne enterolobii]
MCDCEEFYQSDLEEKTLNLVNGQQTFLISPNLLGSGQYGDVYHAFWPHYGICVALKEFNESNKAKSEIKVLARINDADDHIIQMHGYQKYPRTIIVMELGGMNFDNYFSTEILQGQEYNANYHEDILTDMLLCAARAESIVRYLSIIFARIGMLHCVWRVLYFTSPKNCFLVVLAWFKLCFKVYLEKIFRLLLKIIIFCFIILQKIVVKYFYLIILDGIHMDIKGINFVTIKGQEARGEMNLCKIIDFNSSFITDNGEIDVEKKAVIGTGLYLPPEIRNQLGGHHIKLTQKMDIYAFGVTIYKFLFSPRDELRGLYPDSLDYYGRLGLLAKACLRENPHYRPEIEEVICFLMNECDEI